MVMSKEFRKVWFVADAVPMLSATAGAVALGLYIMYNKLFHDPAVCLTSRERLGGVPEQYASDKKNETQGSGLWKRFKNQSYLIFGPRDGVNQINDWKEKGNILLKDQVFTEDDE